MSARHDQDIDLETHQHYCQRVQPFKLSFGISLLDGNIFPSVYSNSPNPAKLPKPCQNAATRVRSRRSYPESWLASSRTDSVHAAHKRLSKPCRRSRFRMPELLIVFSPEGH